ncbi:MAG: 3-hydroxyacyl-CoA dehydrogenase [Rhodospirillaceae bacterium]|nr:MAG: 3-hydroxyacyl-CoA dehydrogenase [Rhodospirillaceae bacterium]
MAAVNYETDGDVAILTIDNPPVNALAYPVRVGLRDGLARALGDANVKAVVLICAGRTFSAGADFTEFSQPGGPKEPRVRQIVQTIEASAKPIIAALHGTALGGGFELAMSCHWRIAHRSTMIGLPEVNIGVIPGGGGTQRTPRLAGPEVALEMTTSGKHYEAEFGLKHGLIDELVDGDLRPAAIAFARRLASEGRPLRVTSRLDEKVRGVNPQIFADFRKKFERRGRGLIAPWKCIDAIEIACRDSFEEGTKFEQAAFEECRVSPQRGALQHLFSAERTARKIPDIGDAKPMPIRKAAILGSGTMGGGIAMCFANAGIPVALIDVSEDAVRKGMSVIEKNYATSVERGSTSPEDMRAALALIKPTTDYAAVGDVDIVIEAIVENMAVKKDVFAKLDKLAPRHTILASNTSSLDIDEIASATSRPEKVVGTHFFSPANVMKLLENVRGAKSSPETLATVMGLHKIIDKVVVLAGNCNGFIGNRMFQFYNTGWEYLMEEGATPEQIDRVATDFGFAMGPCAVRDLAGLDVAVMVRAARAPSLPKEERLSPILERLVAAGRLGQKSGAGVYKYEGRKQISDPETIKIAEQVAADFGIKRRKVADEEIMPRMLYPLINEGAKILEEGIALRASDIDVTYCHGYGFPKHLGGPMYWAQQQGFDKILAMMNDLSKSLGPRYRPAPLLVRLAASGKGW